jgi:hypothetical protein
MSKAAELAKSGDTLKNQPSGRKNIVINGGMQISQRATSSTGVGNASGYFGPDRWKIHKDATTAGRLTMTQSTDAPDGFANSLKMDCTTADTSIAAGERLNLACSIEGFDCQHIKKGTSDALPMTLSFYVKGDQAATYNVEVGDFDNNRCFYKRFAVTTSWNRIIISIPADTTGAFTNDNGESIALGFWLVAGSTYNGGTFVEDAWSTYADNVRSHSSNTQFFDSTDREFFITGIQLEVGSQATNFEHRSRGEELTLCQRYYQTINPGVNSIYASGYQANSERVSQVHRLGVTMRAAPTCAVNGTFTVSNASQPVFTSFNTNTVSTHFLQNSGSAASGYYHANGTDDFFSMDADM